MGDATEFVHFAGSLAERGWRESASVLDMVRVRVRVRARARARARIRVRVRVRGHNEAAPLTMGVSTYLPWPCLLLPGLPLPCLLLPCLLLTLTLTLTLTRLAPPGGSLSRRCLAARRGASRGRRAGLCSRSACSNWEVRASTHPF